MNASDPVFPPPRVAPHAGHAFGGIWRLTCRRFLKPGQLLAIFGLLALLGVLAWAMIRPGNDRSFFFWMAGFYFSSVLSIPAFLIGAGAIRDEMKAGAVDYTLTRPVPRPAFVVFKFLSHLACVQAAYLLALGVPLGVGMARGFPGLAAVLPGLLLGQIVAVTTFFALGYLCGVLTSRYIVLGLLWGAIVEVGIGNIPTQLSRLSITHQIRAIVEPMLPGVAEGLGREQSVAGIVITLLVAAAGMVGVVAAVFSRRELADARAA